MSPLGGDGCAAALAVTTSVIPDDKLVGFRGHGIVAAMHSFSNTTGMWRGNRGSQRKGRNIPHESEEEQ